MSSLTTIYSRKRRSDDECSSSDSDEDARPVKKSRVLNREPNIGDVLARKFQNLVNWIYRLPVGDHNDRESMLKSGLDGNVPIEIEEEEEDIDVVEINAEDDDLIIEEEFTCISDQSTRKDYLHRNSIPIPVVTHPLSSSTPVYRGHNGTRGRTLNSLSRRPVNGCNNSKTYPTRNKRDGTILQKLTYNRNIAPITNPSLDVEILLDTRETPGEESDDLEIVSEISNGRSSRRLTRQTVSPVVSKFGQASKECNGTSPDSIVNGKAASCERQKSLNKSSTAHEVFRLQEKYHYQLILDKMIGTSTYRPVTPKKDPRPTEIQVDLTGDDKPLVPSHFKKENLEKPVNEFLQKYYKPCKFKPCASPKDNSEVEIFTVDDDVQVIETEASDDYYKYKPKFSKGPGIFSAEWINELKKTINLETAQHLQFVTAQEDKLKRYRERRAARVLKGKILRGQSISPDQSEKDEFPELTPDMDDRIEWAFLLTQPSIETLSTFKDCTCNRNDIVTLSGLNWLNDSVINFYLALVMERGKNHPVYPSVYAFNSYFYSSLKSRGPKAVMRWTRKIEDSKNIFQFDILFVPLHLGMHWALCVVDNRMKKIKYYDSMQGTDDQCLRILQNYLVVEKKEKLGIAMDPSAYSLEIVKDIPQQMNGSDCGMFTLKYAEYISRDAPITFSQEHMQYFRRRMVIEILDKKLF
ncbi:Sentrin-specific protease 1 [Araneus ventricosus]|uniref:Sentrin-specific protease 1 n=1 Tax=Araneus ventricosus TaxID=182803 RepID=A0A4Y2DHQ7_ARAVE|nr:Sentrin-specific protease 1 [Araneus ventricosus]